MILAKTDPALILGVISLIGVLGTALFSFLGNRQTRETQQETNAQTMARDEIEQALASQRDRLSTIHTEYREEINSLLAKHGREIEATRARGEEELRELHTQIGHLRSRAEAAEQRANDADRRANESAAHALRCDKALSEMQQDTAALRLQIEEMKQ